MSAASTSSRGEQIDTQSVQSVTVQRVASNTRNQQRSPSEAERSERSAPNDRNGPGDRQNIQSNSSPTSSSSSSPKPERTERGATGDRNGSGDHQRIQRSGSSSKAERTERNARNDRNGPGDRQRIQRSSSSTSSSSSSSLQTNTRGDGQAGPMAYPSNSWDNNQFHGAINGGSHGTSGGSLGSIASGERRQGRYRRQVIRLPDQAQGQVRQVRRRLPTPEPDTLERMLV
jgi:hypothetical protein